MDTMAVVLEAPGKLALKRLPLIDAGPDDAVVETLVSGISTGTEKLLYTGRMPSFPGMGYPLVPGYETIGRVARAAGRLAEGDLVFVPGARCYPTARGLFGGASARLVVPADRLTRLDPEVGEDGVLFALAATARRAVAGGRLPDVIVGHGVLGRLIARITVALGGAPTVLETDPARRSGAEGYPVLDPADLPPGGAAVVLDASGTPDVLDQMIDRLKPGGEVVLAGFYDTRLAFAFAPAFLREVRIRISAEWRPEDLAAVVALVREGRLSLKGLVTHRAAAADAADAYGTAFGDAACLKMILDWRGTA